MQVFEFILFCVVGWFVIPGVVTFTGMVGAAVLASYQERMQTKADRLEYDLHTMGLPMHRIRLDLITAYPNSSQGKAYRAWNLENIRKRTRIRDGEQREA